MSSEVRKLPLRRVFHIHDLLFLFPTKKAGLFNYLLPTLILKMPFLPDNLFVPRMLTHVLFPSNDSVSIPDFALSAPSVMPGNVSASFLLALDFLDQWQLLRLFSLVECFFPVLLVSALLCKAALIPRAMPLSALYRWDNRYKAYVGNSDEITRL